MPELNDLWDWLAYVRETNAYLIVLPSFVGVVLACIADWMETNIANFGETDASQGRAQAPTRGPQHAQGAMAHLDQRQVPSRAS
jgi:hypothetical protein